MKAIVYTKYGPPDVLQLREVAKPVPKDNLVLVKVQAASANALDFRRFTSTSVLGRFMDGVLLKAINTVLGVDIAGRVEAVGAAVKQFQPGDEVFGGCKGAFAEYACADENELALKPANLSFEAAAAVPVAALTALQGLRDKGQIQPGQKVLIHGVLGGSLAQFFQGVLLGPLISRLGSKKMRSFIARINQTDLVFIKELLESGKVVPVIDRCYPLNETAEAIRYLVEGHAPGKVVITVAQNNHT